MWQERQKQHSRDRHLRLQAEEVRMVHQAALLSDKEIPRGTPVWLEGGRIKGIYDRCKQNWGATLGWGWNTHYIQCNGAVMHFQLNEDLGRDPRVQPISIPGCALPIGVNDGRASSNYGDAARGDGYGRGGLYSPQCWRPSSGPLDQQLSWAVDCCSPLFALALLYE